MDANSIYEHEPWTIEDFLDETSEIHKLYFYDTLNKCHRIITLTTRHDYEMLMTAYRCGKLTNVANLMEANGDEPIDEHHNKMQARFVLQG